MSGVQTSRADLIYMKQALKLAKQGWGKVNPNPLVGALIVKENRIISEGYHRQAGQPHAEYEALLNAHESVKGATLYVNLEPCFHYGKTPPCVNMIIEAGIDRVVIANRDPNPQVNGQSITLLRENGITVTEGILASAGRKLNERFFTWIEKKRPFIALKLALTLDGKIADIDGNSKWITNPYARRYVHHLRAGFDALLTGAGTIRCDNPQLTVRYGRHRHNPYRLIVSYSGDLPPDAHIFSQNQDQKTRLISPTYNESLKELDYILLPTGSQSCFTASDLIDAIYRAGYSSVFIEAGEQLSALFLDEKWVDRIYLFYGPVILGPGKSPFQQMTIRSLTTAKRIKFPRYRQFDDCFMIEGALE